MDHATGLVQKEVIEGREEDLEKCVETEKARQRRRERERTGEEAS